MTSTEKQIPFFADFKDVDTTLEAFVTHIARSGAVSKEVYQRDDNSLEQLKLLKAPVKAVYIGSPARLGEKHPTVDIDDKNGNIALIFLEDGTVVYSTPFNLCGFANAGIGVKFKIY